MNTPFNQNFLFFQLNVETKGIIIYNCIIEKLILMTIYARLFFSGSTFFAD